MGKKRYGFTPGFEYTVGGNTFVNTPVIIAYDEDPIVTVAPRPRDQLALELYIYHEGRHLAVVQQDRIFPTQEGARDRYRIVREAYCQRILDTSTDRVIAALKRRAPRRTYEVELYLGLPDGGQVVATPEGLEVDTNKFVNCRLEGVPIAIGIGDMHRIARLADQVRYNNPELFPGVERQ